MSTKTTFKRIALVAVASLGFGVLSSVTPASAAILTGSVSPVRVTFTQALDGTFSQDSTPQAQISWTAGEAHLATDTVTVTLTAAPTAAALVQIGLATEIGTTYDNFANAGTGGNANLTTASAVAGIAMTGQTTTNGKVSLQANTAGTYRGSLGVFRAGVARDTVNFAFTTRGAVASFTATVSAASLAPSATGTHTVTLLDANGNTTQPLMVDTFANTTTGGVTGTTAYTNTAATATDGVISLATTSLADGVASQTYTAGNVANTVGSYVTTPAGTLGSLAAQTLAVTTDATAIDVTTVTAYDITAPADAAAQTGTLDNADDGTAADVRQAAVRAGTTDVTLVATSTVALAGSTLRFRIAGSAGTIDGVAVATPVFKNVVVNALGEATISFTIGGNGTIAGQSVTVRQVNVANGVLAGNSTIQLVQTAAAAVGATITNSAGASLVRALGTTTSVDVTVRDQYLQNLGAGWTVQAFRGTTTLTLLSTGTTNASGVATVSISPLSTVVTGGTETYTYQASRPGITAITAAVTTTVTYTTTGAITSMSSAIVGQANGVLTPVLHTTTVAAQTVLPAVRVVTNGSANDAAGTGIFTVATGAQTGGDTANTLSRAVQITTTNVPANSTTYTASEGAALCTSVATGACAWNAGLSTRTIAAGSSVFAYATKTGEHTITATSGDKTTTIKFFAYNAATDFYTVSAAADSTSIKTGQTGVVTVNVKDIFGNAVDTTGQLLTATAADKVRLAGQALTQTIDTGVAGTFAFTVLADATAGSGTITIAPTTTGAEAWGASYVAPTGAAAPVKSATLTFTVTGATLKTVDDLAAEQAAAAVAAKAVADKAAADKVSTDAAIAALKAQLDAAAAKAAADKASSDAAIAAAQAAAVEAATAAADAAAEATDAANAATDAANASAEAGDAATAAAQDAADAVAALATQVSEMIDTLKKQITALTNLVIKIQKKVKA
jgi:trimeric autotransporter adhesin